MNATTEINGTAKRITSASSETSVAMVQVDPRNAVATRSLDDAWALAGSVVAVGYCGIKSQDDAYLRIITGMELGLTALQSVRSVDMIQGRPAIRSEMKVALCRARRDVCAYFQMVESTETRAIYETQRVGNPRPTRHQFTIEQAQKQGLTKKENWQKDPASMLRARASGQLCVIEYSDLINGIGDEGDDEDPIGPTHATVTQVTPDTRSAPRPTPKVGEVTVHAEPAKPAADPTPEEWAKRRTDLLAEIASASLADFPALRAKIEKLAPKGAPIRGALVKASTAAFEAAQAKAAAPPPAATTADEAQIDDEDEEHSDDARADLE